MAKASKPYPQIHFAPVETGRYHDMHTAVVGTSVQHAYLERIEWIRVDLPDVISNVPITRLHAHVAQCPVPLGLYLYGSDLPPTDAPPDGNAACVVWDCRDVGDLAPGDALTIPCTVRGDGGALLRLTAISSEPAYAWPIEVGDRVFIELTPTRAAHASLLQLEEAEREKPELFDTLMRKHGSRDVIRRVIEDNLLTIGLGDEARATDALVQSVRRAQTVFADILPGLQAARGKVRDAVMASNTIAEAVEAFHAGAAATRVDMANPGAEGEYMRIAYALLRGDVGRGGTLAADIGFDALIADADDEAEVQLAMRVHRHAMAGGATIDAEVWLDLHTMNHGEDCLLFSGMFYNERDDVYGIEMHVEWCGLDLELVGIGHDPDDEHAAATKATAGRRPRRFDIGCILLARFVPRDGDRPLPWIAVRHWPMAERSAIDMFIHDISTNRRFIGQQCREIMEMTHRLMTERDGVGAKRAARQALRKAKRN